MKYYLDSEFIEDGKTIDLISISIVADDGREFYAESVDADLSKASDWVRENVIPNLWSREVFDMWGQAGAAGGLLSREAIASEVLEFCNPIKFGKPEFWADYAPYDWVVVCQLFGTMMDLPEGFPMYCNDLQQWRRDLRVDHLPEQSEGQHNALEDARHCKALWEYLHQQ